MPTIQLRLPIIPKYASAYIEQFNQEYHSDNNKKIKSMNEAIKKAVKTKCFKGLDDYKRVPWTYEILQRIHSFAKSLMEHSPFRR